MSILSHILDKIIGILNQISSCLDMILEMTELHTDPLTVSFRPPNMPQPYYKAIYSVRVFTRLNGIYFLSVDILII